jgi:nitroimidazol reductase NimA-like FMN-containing flavoprotein (pyridoxamine 5'-phosphate oxidase superfamily)
MSGHPELDAMARRVIDANHYMVLGTAQPDGGARVSPVYFTPARYTDFYWLSSPEARHSRNIAERPAVEIVIYDSTARVGDGQAVYVTATARAVADDEVDDRWGEAFRARAGARSYTPDEVRDLGLRLYVAQATGWEVHLAGRHPLNTGGIDVRMPADPTRGP